eukprot:scaffold26645_cov150-Skeletonema_menzelii.AAC.4
MGIESGSTNRWKTARERNRLKARFDIQSKIAELVQMEQSLSSLERNYRASSLDEMNIILKYLQAIIKNDVSTFSATSLASHHQNNDIRQYQLVNGPLPHCATSESNDTDSTSCFDLSSGIPKNGAATIEQAKYALQMMTSANIPWMRDDDNIRTAVSQCQPATLATSKYGRDYVAERLIPYMHYLQSHGDNLTLMEYASLLGRHQIVGLLLIGGFDPSTTRMMATTDGQDCGDGNNNDEETKEIEHYKRAGKMASQKVLSFFHCLHINNDQKYYDQSDRTAEFDSGNSVIVPMSIWQYMIRAVVEMRINGALTSVRDNNQQSTEQFCSVCSPQHQSSSHHQRSRPLLLNFGQPCSHSFCEPCLWIHLLQHVPNCTDLDSMLVTCPKCSADFKGLKFCENGDLNHNRQKGRETSASNNDGTGSGDIFEEKKDDTIQGSIETAGPMQRRERRLQSYTKFMILPATSTELKLQRRTKHKAAHQPNQQKFNSKRRKAKDPSHCTWKEALQPLVDAQQSRDVRSDRFFRAVASSSVQLVIVYLNAGIDVNMQNEYGQTPLYIACWKGTIDVVKWLLDFGADLKINANGGSSCYCVANRSGRIDVMELLVQYHDHPIPLDNVCPAPRREQDNFQVTTLIDENSDHPGAGACMVDNALSEEQLCFLDSLQQSLPVIEACDEDVGGQRSEFIDSQSRSDKSNYRPSRSYYCDFDQEIQNMLQGCIIAARHSMPREHDENDTHSFNDTLSPKSVFQHIRFLKYERKGGVLPAHVDLCRVDEKSGQRSTHTFILYLTTCENGGGTALLDELSSPTVLAVAQPKRGRALIFPHNTPHSGLEVDCVPKVLLRGEVIL